MAIMDTLGLSSANYWQWLSNAVMLFAVVVGFIVLLIFVAFLVLRAMFDRKAIIFPGFGDPSFYIREEIKKDKDGKEVLDEHGNQILEKFVEHKEGLVLGVPYTKKARLVSKSGVVKLQLMTPFVSTNPLSPDMVYPEGVYVVKLGNEYIPIRKPGIDAEKGYLIKLGSWQSFKEANFLAFKAKRQKYADKDEKMKIFAMFLVAMVLTVLVSGFVSWSV